MMRGLSFATGGQDARLPYTHLRSNYANSLSHLCLAELWYGVDPEGKELTTKVLPILLDTCSGVQFWRYVACGILLTMFDQLS